MGAKKSIIYSVCRGELLSNLTQSKVSCVGIVSFTAEFEAYLCNAHNYLHKYTQIYKLEIAGAAMKLLTLL